MSAFSENRKEYHTLPNQPPSRKFAEGHEN